MRHTQNPPPAVRAAPTLRAIAALHSPTRRISLPRLLLSNDPTDTRRPLQIPAPPPRAANRNWACPAPNIERPLEQYFTPGLIIFNAINRACTYRVFFR